MPLRCSECGKGERVRFVKLLRYIDKVAIAAEVGRFCPSIAVAGITACRNRPAVVHQTGRYIEAVLHIAIVADAHKYVTALLSVHVFSNDIDGTANGGDAQTGCTQTALYLDEASHIGKPCPVTPVHFTVFHIVHRHAINHHTDVFRTETAQRDTRVAKTTVTTCYVNGRG